MCWNGTASTTLAVAGIATTAYAAWKGEKAALWVPLAYFSLMEALQAFSYSVIDRCGLPSNQIATMLGYLHISFQPFFVNAVAMYFIPQAVRSRIQLPVYAACLVSAVFMLLQVYPFEWAGRCDPSTVLCAERLCSVRGNWHIAWDLPINGLGGTTFNGFPTYAITAFIIPLLYGSWRFTAYQWLVGPFLAGLTTTNMNEIPAIWCLFSIGLLIVVMKTPIRPLLHVRGWLLWPREWRRSSATVGDAAGPAALHGR
jgi:hypothetical protein